MVLNRGSICPADARNRKKEKNPCFYLIKNKGKDDFILGQVSKGQNSPEGSEPPEEAKKRRRKNFIIYNFYKNKIQNFENNFPKLEVQAYELSCLYAKLSKY